ncbi:hypothetical protein L208DRAFT_1404505 [Tricholoma matsutake]|nr:hypothetical protein L208DRAFT_1404505 [Tricholoma matsutake 945]
MWSFSSLLLVIPVVYAQTLQFIPPSLGPTVESSNYVGMNNGSLPKPHTKPGKVFNRIIQIWLENTDFETAYNNPVFASLAKEGILLDQYYAMTHPSEPNYAAVVGGDFFGMADDNLYAIPSNISTVVDLLDAKKISWASYQENMPTDGFTGFNYTSTNYLNTSAPPYTFYVRKHNPLVLYDSVANVPERASLLRNFNDFAADIIASAIPQWVFVTPNLVNDGHDTNILFMASWLNYWLIPLLKDTRFNDDKTLIILTFDENKTGTINNRIWALLLGGAVPSNLHGTTDSTYYTHYSSLSTVQANWELDSLGRGDTNKTLSNVYSFIASETGYKNNNISGASIPLTNLSGTYPGPLNPKLYAPYAAPNYCAVGAGGGPVFVPGQQQHGSGYYQNGPGSCNSQHGGQKK